MSVDVRMQLVTMLPRLRRFAFSLTGSRDRADDLLQTTCEKALRGLESWQTGTRLDSWLYRIMQNAWIDDMRKVRFRGPELPIEDDIAGADGVLATEANITAADVMTALSKLPDEQRSVVTLVCVEDLSYREVAHILGVPIGTVMSRLSRARRALADAIGVSPLADAGRFGGAA